VSVFAAAGPSAYWYLARSTGAVSLVMLTASVVLGVLGSLRFTSAPRWPRFAIDALHRDISLLVLAFLAIHIVTSVLDGFAPIGLADAVLPLGSSYRPLWMGLGALSFDLLLALVATSLVRRRLGYSAWRAIHWLAYASWPVAVLHGLGAGSDTKEWWMLAVTAACIGAILIAILTRLARIAPRSSPIRAPAIALSIATPLGIGIFTFVGPLRPGWARRAGTPAALLAKTTPAPTPVASRGAATRTASNRPLLVRPFTATVAGTITQTSEPGGAIVDMALRLSGHVPGNLRVRLAGAPLDGGGLSMTGSQVDLVALGFPSVMDGRIISLRGQQFVARVRNSSGSVLDLRANLNIDGQGGVSGTVAAVRPGAGRS
jgi:methionine sulfoxide reductase heme-binding subunit